VLGGDVLDSGIARVALERGGHLRLGLEDHAGSRTPTNEELVREAVALADDVGRPVASCDEAAKVLNLP
jgi:3-keto-5-aminohexanoate cleavage enzyme